MAFTTTHLIYQYWSYRKRLLASLALVTYFPSTRGCVLTILAVPSTFGIWLFSTKMSLIPLLAEVLPAEDRWDALPEGLEL